MYEDDERANCFAREGNYCKATYYRPPGGCKRCKFYKTKSQLARERRYAKARLDRIGYVQPIPPEGERYDLT